MADYIIRGNQNTTKLINSLKKSIEQYPCLTKVQEQALINKYRNDRETLNKMLFMHNIRTVFSLAKQYMAQTNDYDSLVQNGMIGLGEAVRRFDIDRDIKFCTYATLWVKKYMTMYFYSSQYKLDSKTISMNSPSLNSDADAGDAVSPEDTFENCIGKYIDPSIMQAVSDVGSQISAMEQSDICRQLYAYMDSDTSLSATDKAVFEKLFIDHEKTRNIAMMYNLDMAAVSEIKNRILGKMRTILQSKYKINSYLDLA